MRVDSWRRCAVCLGLVGQVAWSLVAPASAGPASAPVEIGIVEREADFATWGFDPADATAAPGDTVRWTNRGRIDHNIFIQDPGLSSDILHPGDATEYRFTAAGVYRYVCGLHPTMTGTVTVGP